MAGGLKMLGMWKYRVGQLKRETYTLYLAYRDPRTPWYAKVLGALVVGYAFSPIDLIPDAIPILGYLDDLLLVPLGIFFTLKMIPPVVLDECRQEAGQVMQQGKPTNWAAAGAIVLIWLASAITVALLVYRVLGR
jgi:uncharacterized membrane protein YkvA (DUF1232 family)